MVLTRVLTKWSHIHRSEPSRPNCQWIISSLFENSANFSGNSSLQNFPLIRTFSVLQIVLYVCLWDPIQCQLWHLMTRALKKWNSNYWPSHKSKSKSVTHHLTFPNHSIDISIIIATNTFKLQIHNYLYTHHYFTTQVAWKPCLTLPFSPIYAALFWEIDHLTQFFWAK